MVPKYDEKYVVYIQTHFRRYLAMRLYQLKKAKKQREPNPIVHKKAIIYGDYYFNVTVSYSKNDDCYIVKGSSGTYFTYIESLVVAYKKIDFDPHGPHTSKTKRLASTLLKYVCFYN